MNLDARLIDIETAMTRGEAHALARKLREDLFPAGPQHVVLSPDEVALLLRVVRKLSAGPCPVCLRPPTSVLGHQRLCEVPEALKILERMQGIKCQ